MRRLETLVMPAIGTMREIMLRGESHAVRLKAATEVLDRAGIVAPQQVEVDNHVSITVSYEDVETAKQIVIDQAVSLPLPGSIGRNGHADVEL